MQAGKIYFVHLRETDERGEFKQHGGATIAWAVTHNGDIVIGQPARCHSGEKFVKEQGREVARGKFNSQDASLVIPHTYIQSYAMAEASLHLDHPFMTPSARMALMDSFGAMLIADVTDVMATSWFEQLVRARFELVNNRVKTNFDEAKEAEANVVVASIEKLVDIFASLAK